jgi:hypothetical protein
MKKHYELQLNKKDLHIIKWAMFTLMMESNVKVSKSQFSKTYNKIKIVEAERLRRKLK